VEEAVYGTGLVGEAAAFGIAHPVLGQAILVVATDRGRGDLDTQALLGLCRDRLPAFMVPARIIERKGSLPRNPNGKIDRKRLAQEFAALFEASA
jgi:acyl-CoA synthetase (AMP-forming)/AMP-acid ligase II